MIPDDEPWWMVRRTMQAAAIGDGYGGSSSALPCTCPLADETEEPKDFRPFGYEW